MTKHLSPTSIGGPGKLQCEAFISRSRRRILIYKSSKYHKPCWMTLTLTRTTRILTWKASDVELSLSKPSLELIAVRNVGGGGGNAHHRRHWGHHHRWRRLDIIPEDQKANDDFAGWQAGKEGIPLPSPQNQNMLAPPMNSFFVPSQLCPKASEYPNISQVMEIKLATAKV